MREFNLTFRELSFDKQEDLIRSLIPDLMDIYQISGEKFMSRNWIVKPKIWQEAFCRYNAIRSNMWSDLDETSEEFQKIDWKYYLTEYAEKEAENRLTEAFNKLKVEVEL